MKILNILKKFEILKFFQNFENIFFIDFRILKFYEIFEIFR